MAAPTSQKADVRPISFVLEESGAPLLSLDLAIRPEDLTRQDPSRLSVVQTLGGAWGDDFGPGIGNITLSGTTGWRAGGGVADGEARFKQLRTAVFDEWHIRRAAARKAGKNPDAIALVLADSLNNTIDQVAPNSFTLRRSRSRPLLLQYQISLTVLGKGSSGLDGGGGDVIGNGGSGDDESLLDTIIASMSGAIDRIGQLSKDIGSFIDRNFTSYVGGFITSAMAVFKKVTGLLSGGSSAFGAALAPLIGVAQLLSSAGATVMRTIRSSVNNIAGQNAFSLLAASFFNIACALGRLRRNRLFSDFSSLFGASNCSSTLGGRPISNFVGFNTFAAVAPATAAPAVVVSSGATTSLQTLAASDPVLAPLSTTVITGHLATIASGLVP